jgi:immune inhibitor A
LPNSNPRRNRHLAVLAAGGLLTGGLFALTPATASPGEAGPSDSPSEAGRDTGHEPKHPLKIKQKRDAQLQAALERKLDGKSPFKGGGHAVPLEREGTDKIFVVLAEFGNERFDDPRFQDDPNFDLPDPEPTTFDGPMHNQIPEPDRSTDNSTLWQPNYDRAHFEDMYFNRMASYYERQSSGRYSVDGDVTEWVKVPFNQALYGRGYCGDPAGSPVTTCASTKALVRDALAVWVDQQLKSGKTMAEITDYLKTFDHQDRYDVDGDGNYQEPDGFIDHFQIVHAGGDEAAGDPTYGTDAIWSHRWYSNLQGGGPGGLPGVNVGSNAGAFGYGTDAEDDLDTRDNPVPHNPTGVWVGDYTIQPENGGLGVFAHEFGHDLGLPDLYDTSGNTGGAENSTAFWSLMSSGANIGDGGPDGIGDNPTDLGAWELLQLGWLDPQGKKGPFYDVASAGETSQHRLGNNNPATTGGAQALFTLLPDAERPLELGAPATGSQMFWSTQGDDLNTTMTKSVAGGTNLTARVNYDIETDWDYAFLEAEVNGAWTPVTTNLSDTAGDQSGFNTSKTGMTGTTAGVWKSLTATLPASTNAVRFRYHTDGAVAEKGFRVDDIAIDGSTIGTAETADEGWTFNGFRTTSGSEIEKFFNAYVAENRQYDGYDASLKSAYNFGFAGSKPDWVESYPYQNGMLVSYWNTSYTDNNVGDHPGAGLILPIDANPVLPHWSDGNLMRPRIAAYDSTFGVERSQAITVHAAGQAGRIASSPARKVFDDTKTWWFEDDAHAATGDHAGRYQPGWFGVDPPNTGTQIQVLDQSGGAMTVRVSPVR